MANQDQEIVIRRRIVEWEEYQRRLEEYRRKLEELARAYTVSLKRAEYDPTLNEVLLEIVTTPPQPNKRYEILENGVSVAQGNLDNEGKASVTIPGNTKIGTYVYYVRVNSVLSPPARIEIGRVAVKMSPSELKKRIRQTIDELGKLKNQAKVARPELVSDIERWINWATSEVSRRTRAEDLKQLLDELERRRRYYIALLAPSPFEQLFKIIFRR